MVLKNRSMFLRNMLILILLISFCSLSLYAYIYRQKTVEYFVPPSNINTIEIVQGDVVKQDIQINKYIKNLQLFVANGGGDRANINRGSIEFSLVQGDIKEQGVLDINGIGDWVYVDVPVNLKSFTDGIATLEFKGIDVQQGSSIYMVHETQDIYELSPVKYNENQLNGPLCLKYETANQSINYSTFIIFSALSLVICIVLAVLISNNQKNSYIYIATIALIFCIVAFRYPTYTVTGEVWAEVGNLYIPSATSKSFTDNLFTLEMGLYVNMLGRLLTWILIHIIPSKYFVVVAMNVISLLLVSIMGASLSSGVFKKYISPIESIVLSVLVTTCMVDAETIATPLITSYWAIIPLTIIFASFILKVKIPNKLFILWTILIILSIFSRMSYVIFVPILIVYAIWYKKQLTKRQLIFTGVIAVLCLSEGVLSLVIRNIANVTANSIEIPSLATLINGLLYYQVQILNAIGRIQASANMLTWNLFLLVLLIGFCISMFICIIKKKYVKLAKALLLVLAISFGQCCLQLVTEGFSPLGSGINWEMTVSMPHNRQWMFCLFAYFVIVLVVYCYIKYNYKNSDKLNISAYKFIAWFVFICIFSVQSTSSGSTFYNIADDLGDYNTYYNMSERDAFIFPFAPSLAWNYAQNCTSTIGNTELSNQIELNLQANNVISVYVPRSKSTNQLEHKEYFINLYDLEGNLICTIPQISDLEENLIGFDIGTQVNGISKVTFTYENGENAYVEGEYLVGYQ